MQEQCFDSTLCVDNREQQAFVKFFKSLDSVSHTLSPSDSAAFLTLPSRPSPKKTPFAYLKEKPMDPCTIPFTTTMPTT